MAFQDTDVVLDLDEIDNPDPNSDTHITGPVNFILNRTYYLAIIGEHGSALDDPSQAIGEPVTTGVTWAVIGTKESSAGGLAIAVYEGTVTEEGAATTTITYPDVQSQSSAVMMHMSNSGAYLNVVTATAAAANALTVTLATIASLSAAISFFGVDSTRSFTVGTNEVAISGVTSRYSLGQRNFDGDESLDCTFDGSPANVVGIGFEVPLSADATLLTLHLTDDGTVTGADVVSQTTAGFEAGFRAYKNLGETNEEEATELTAVDTQPTATPQFLAAFPTGDPVTDTDLISFVYLAIADSGAGDITNTVGGQPLASGTYTAEASMICTV